MQPLMRVNPSANTASTSSAGWFSSMTWFEKLNGIAALAHLVNAIVVLSLLNTNEDVLYPLFKTRIYAHSNLTSGGSLQPILDFHPLQEITPAYNGSFTCAMLQPQKFGSMYFEHFNYDIGAKFSLVAAIASFFFLSFFFQASALIPMYNYRARIQQDVPNGEPMSAFQVHWLRYVEYSISASVMLMIVAAGSDITNVDLLLCIAFLSASCMIFGLASDLCRRAGYYRNYSVLFSGGKGEEGEGNMFFGILPDPKSYNRNSALQVMRRTFSQASLFFHLMGWVCILVPWGIIIDHFSMWWQSCDTTDAGPPDFLQGVVVGQFVFFNCFGFVQLAQQFRVNPVTVELTYITLSLSAKMFLAWFLLARVFINPP